MLIEPILNIFLSVVTALLGPVINIFLGILKGILAALCVGLKSIILALIEAGVFYPFIVVYLWVKEFILTLIGSVGAFAKICIYSLLTGLRWLLTYGNGIYMFFYEFIMAFERNPRAFYRNPSYFNALYKSVGSIQEYISSGSSLLTNPYINDHIPGMILASKPVDDPNFIPESGYSLTYIGDEQPVYVTEIQLYRDMMAKMYKDMLSSGVLSNMVVVEKELKHIETTAQKNPPKFESFDRNWSGILPYLRIALRFSKDSEAIAKYYAGTNLTENAFLIAYGDMQAQRLYNLFIDPKFDLTSTSLLAIDSFSMITDLTGINISNVDSIKQDDLTNSVNSQDLTKVADSINTKLLLCTSFFVLASAVHYSICYPEVFNLFNQSLISNSKLG